MFLFIIRKYMGWWVTLCCLLNVLCIDVFAGEENENIISIPVSAYCLNISDTHPVFSWSYSQLFSIDKDVKASYSIKAELIKDGKLVRDISSDLLDKSGSIDYKTLLFDSGDDGCNCDEADCSLKITIFDNQNIVAYGAGYVQKINPSLPVISIITDKQGPVCPSGNKDDGDGCDKKLKADIFIYNSTIDASLELLHEGRCGINVRGNTSRGFPKKQYSLEMRDLNDDDIDVNMLDMGIGEDWVLNASWFDRSFIANKLAFEFFRSLDPVNNFSVDSRYVELFINDEYMGVYLLTQPIKREYIKRFFNDDFSSDDEDTTFIVTIGTEDPQINYKERFVSYFATELENAELKDKLDFYANDFQRYYGPIFYPQNTFDLFYRSLYTFFYKMRYPTETSKLSVVKERNLINYFLSFEETVLNQPSSGTGLMFNYLSMNSAVDYTIVQELFLSFDSYAGNFYLYRNQAKGEMSFTVWDFDRALGTDLTTYWYYIYGTLYDPLSYIENIVYLYDKFKLSSLDDLPLPGCLQNKEQIETDFYVVMPRSQMFWEMLRTEKFQTALKNRIANGNVVGDPMSITKIIELIDSMIPLENKLTSVNGHRLTKIALDRNFNRWPYDSDDYSNLGFCVDQFTDYDNEINRIKQFLQNRLEALGGYIDVLVNKAGIFNYKNANHIKYIN